MRFALPLLAVAVISTAAACICHAADPVFHVYAGANGAWFDDNANPSDLEGGGNVVASLSPHI